MFEEIHYLAIGSMENGYEQKAAGSSWCTTGR